MEHLQETIIVSPMVTWQMASRDKKRSQNNAVIKFVPMQVDQ